MKGQEESNRETVQEEKNKYPWFFFLNLVMHLDDVTDSSAERKELKWPLRV